MKSKSISAIAYVLSAVVALTGAVVYVPHASQPADGGAAPLFGLTLPPGYRDWRGVRAVQGWQAGRRRAAQSLLSLPRARQSTGLSVHPLLAMIRRIEG
jgi:hypothetical protein